jgi:hypothetical protein
LEVLKMTWKKSLMVVLVLAVLVGIGWATGVIGGDPELAELKKLRDGAFQNSDSLSEEERRQQREGFRERIGNLDEDQRRQFFRDSQPMFQQMITRRMNDFFESSPEEQRDRLDEIIDRMEAPREPRAERGGDGRPGSGEGGGRGGWENRTPEQRDQRRKERLDRSSPEMRAQIDQFKDKLNDRREQRGLPPVEGFRGMFRGGRGRG